MKGKNRTVMLVAVLVLLSISIYNIVKIGINVFFTTNIGTIVTATIAIVISYFLSQTSIDERKKRDVIDSLIKEAKDIIANVKIYEISESDTQAEILMRQRNLSNCVDLLKKVDDKLISKTEKDNINSALDSYISLVGNHIDDLQTLSTLSKDLKKYINNIDSSLNRIRFNLYDLSK